MRRRVELSPREIELFEEVGQDIVRAIRGIPLEPEGTHNAAVKYADGTYKVKPLPAGVNFFLESSYLGKKGELLFCFEPEEKQEYELAEFAASVVDTVFPLAGSELSANSSHKGEENFHVILTKMFSEAAEADLNDEKEVHEAYADNPLFGMF